MVVTSTNINQLFPKNIEEERPNLPANHPTLSESACYLALFSYLKESNCLWDECDALEAPYMCVCACSCENGRVNGERDQRKRLIQFLMGLDECYANVRGKILLMQPMPTVAKAYGLIRQEEKQREGYVQQILTSATLFAHSNYARPAYHGKNRTNRNFTQGESSNRNSNQSDVTMRRSTFRKGVICEKCSKEGHLSEECYKLVGYPIGYPLHGKYRPPNQRTNTPKTVNMTQKVPNTSTSQDKHPGSTPTTQSGEDLAMSARMDQL
ncbi:cysteine-rich receptor-like protein kinase 8 [Tanacetum coccineum]